MSADAAIAALESKVGEELHVSDWMKVDQARIDRFAEATGDFQWIHVEPDRAAHSDFGSTIAHGFLTLSLIPHLAQPSIPDAPPFDDARMRINYGLDRVRFPHPVPVESRIRTRTLLESVTRVDDRTVQVVRRVTVELDGAEKPACVAQQVVRLAF